METEAKKEFKGFTFFERFRLYLGGELSRLAGWLIPKVDFDEGCEDPPEWIIYSDGPYRHTYSCTFHLPEMVGADTTLIQPYEAVDSHKTQKTCCYAGSGDGAEVPESAQPPRGVEEVK